MKITLTIISLIIFSLPTAFGQGWIKYERIGDYVDPVNAWGDSTGQITIGGLSIDGNDATAFRLDYSSEGNYVSTQHYTPGNISLSTGAVEDFIRLKDNSYIYKTRKFQPAFYEQIIKTDSDGNIDWIVQDTLIWGKIAQINDGFIIAAGDQNGHFSTRGRTGLNFTKMNTNGQVLFSKRYDFFERLKVALAVSDTSVLVVAEDSSINDSIYAFLVDQNLDTLWSRAYTLDTVSSRGCLVTSAIKTPDGGYTIGGFSFTAQAYKAKFFLLKLDQFGNKQWVVINAGGPNFSDGVTSASIALTRDGGYILVGGNNYTLFLIKTDATGNALWQKDFILENNPTTSADMVYEDKDGSFILVGTYRPPCCAGSGDIFIIKTDSLGNANKLLIQGRIYQDLDNTCSYTANDQPASDLLISANGTRRFTGISDSLGFFTIPLEDTGTFVLNIDSAFNNILDVEWNFDNGCDDSVLTVFVPQFFDTLSTDISTEPSIFCPFPIIDIGISRLRRCDSAYVVARYCNEGTEMLDSATIEIDIDDFMNVLSSSVSPVDTLDNNRFTFDVDSLLPNECRSIKFWVQLQCDTTVALGQTHCVQATINPDTICTNVGASIDQSKINVKGSCLSGDSVIFVIKNIGTGTMSAPLNYSIIRDGIIAATNYFQLGSGDSTIVRLAADGATYILLAQQSPGLPSGTGNIAVVEGCGFDSSGNFTVGFTTILPQNDASPLVSIACEENVAACDPNDKSVTPRGFGEKHYVPIGTTFDYLIRFQNTGTDTAFTVVIRDTLSSYLDTGSIRLGASSHDYTFELIPPNEMVWTFTNIQLPDSNINEPLSHGFVKFTIDHKPGIAYGTIIENSVSIYFDANLPVHTNTTYSEIASPDEFWLVNSLQEITDIPLKVYPNPSSSYAILELGTFDQPNIEAQVFLYDIYGRLVKEYLLDPSGTVKMETENLPSGIYLIKVFSSNWSATGKLIVD